MEWETSMTTQQDNQQNRNLDQLEVLLDKTIVQLTDSAGQSYWNKVDDKIFSYFVKQIIHQPWKNHFALGILCLTDRQLTTASIYNITSTLNKRFGEIFHHYDLEHMNQLSSEHFEGYLTKQILPDHSDRQRQSVLTSYNTFSYNLTKWHGIKFDKHTQEQLQPYLLIKLPYDNRDFSARNNAISDAKIKRKEETSAITPLLPEIRAEAHMRFNQVERLQQAFNTVLTSSISNNSEFPVEFHYDESEFVNERWYFFIHDVRRVLSSVPADQRYVLEFIKAENLSDGSAGEGPWFVELLKLKLLGNWSTPYLTPEHRENIMNYLHHWGYETEGSEKIPSPFNPRNIGLLIQGFYVSKASTIENKTFINIHPIYMACLFAKFALDIITSSGARMNELLQISYDKDCCVITIDRAQSPPKKNFILRLTPKGREEPENYYVPEEIFKSIHEIVKVLKEHYKSDHLPEVEYSVSSRQNILNDKRRFVFQINGKHINVFSINAIIRFLLHGVLMETSSGKQVTMKSHLLRHAFATHAVQTEKIPIDIVRVLLHQKDIEVTSYYAAPTNGQLSEAVESMNNSLVSVLDIQKGIIRAPGELQEMYQDYKDRVGTLSRVTGGICTIDSVCPTRMACVGCGAKVPQPSFKDELQEYYNWASESQLKFEKLGLPLEAQKMKITKTRAKNELKEIELLERTIKDKNHEADIRINQTGKNLA